MTDTARNGSMKCKIDGKGNHHETQANQFAVNLLMPEHLILQELANGLSLDEMAEKFLTSRKAMEIRIAAIRRGRKP
jgi:Zn-dependent peptidase ImmA (M78 family)